MKILLVRLSETCYLLVVYCVLCSCWVCVVFCHLMCQFQNMLNVGRHCIIGTQPDYKVHRKECKAHFFLSNSYFFPQHYAAVIFWTSFQHVKLYSEKHLYFSFILCTIAFRHEFLVWKSMNYTKYDTVKLEVCCCLGNTGHKRRLWFLQPSLIIYICLQEAVCIFSPKVAT
jgi:hypothetical protein